MSHKLVLSGLPNQLNYLEHQKNYIKDHFSDLIIEIIDINDETVIKYNKVPDRFPFILLIKNNSYKNSINAKVSNNFLESWLLDNSVNK